jgi:hypothetical protein
MIISQNGVGIGTVPGTSLDVVNSTAADQTPIVIFGDGSNSNRYQFLADRGGGAVFQFTSSGIDSIRSAGDLRFEVNGSTSPTLYITSGGYVGIGTTTPDQILTVAGTLHVTSGGIEFPDGTVQTTTCTAVIPSPGSQTYSTPGTYTFTVPNGVTRVVAVMWGAGGGGGGGGNNSSYYACGGGGGALVTELLNVSSTNSITINVGSGGSGGAAGSGGGNGTSGQTGGASSVTYSGTTWQANGGGGGNYNCGSSATLGGNIPSGQQQLLYIPGGYSAMGNSNSYVNAGGGAPGGSGPGESYVNGANAYGGFNLGGLTEINSVGYNSTSTGGSASAGGIGAGGNGAAGNNSTGAGVAGTSPGGGGSSGGSNTTQQYVGNGGTGGNGQVTLFW